MDETGGKEKFYKIYKKINENKEIKWEKNPFKKHLYYLILISGLLVIILMILASYLIFIDLQRYTISGEYVLTMFFFIIILAIFIVSIWTYPETLSEIGFSENGIYIKYLKGTWISRNFIYYFLKWDDIKVIKYAPIPAWYGDIPDTEFDLNHKVIHNPFLTGLLLKGILNRKFPIFFTSKYLLDRIIIKHQVISKLKG
jgi:hypothetical protein